MYSWLTFYHSSHEVAKDHKPHMTELQSRIQTTRDHFNASREDIQALMRKMLEVRQSVSLFLIHVVSYFLFEGCLKSTY